MYVIPHVKWLLDSDPSICEKCDAIGAPIAKVLNEEHCPVLTS